MGGLRNTTSNNILMLPKNWFFRKVCSANQTFFKYIKREITPAEIQKIMQKKGWLAPPASLAGGAASLIFFENGSRFVQYSLPSRILRPFGQNAPARTKGE